MKRVFDICLAIFGIFLCLPFSIFIILWIKLDSKGPAFYRQTRVGKQGKDFTMFKFRTMYLEAEQRGLLTVGGSDSRITRSGYFLRKYKVDELPQLINVLVGNMSLVGPRPEVRKYVNLYSEEQRRVLLVKPGITDEASILYKNENELLSLSNNPEQTYINDIMPHKISLNMKYISDPSVMNYFNITFRTLKQIVKR